MNGVRGVSPRFDGLPLPWVRRCWGAVDAMSGWLGRGNALCWVRGQKRNVGARSRSASGFKVEAV